jgi:prolyl oligopeptidase
MDRVWQSPSRSVAAREATCTSSTSPAGANCRTSSRASTAARPGAASPGTRTAAVFYTRYPRPGERPDPDLDFYQQLYFHKIGGASDTDAYEIGKDFPKIAEAVVTASGDGRFLLATVKNGDGGEQAHYVRPPAGGWIRLAGYTDEVITGVWGRTTRCGLLSRGRAARTHPANPA